MTTLEVVLICVSSVETVVSAYFYKKHKQNMDVERRIHMLAQKEYEDALERLRQFIPFNAG